MSESKMREKIYGEACTHTLFGMHDAAATVGMYPAYVNAIISVTATLIGHAPEQQAAKMLGAIASRSTEIRVKQKAESPKQTMESPNGN